MIIQKVQKVDELEKWFDKHDPWDYENNPEDSKRREILLQNIPKKGYKKTLDIGCGHGFITKELPGKKVVGIDIANKAILQAKKNAKAHQVYYQKSIYEIDSFKRESFDLIVITGVLYPQYIGHSNNLIYSLVDGILAKDGILVSVHINDWYNSKFPYLLLKEKFYNYREYAHRMEVYIK